MTPHKKSHIVIFGDVMLDTYHHGKATRISPEAPIPVLQVNQTVNRCGGAGNVALNLKHLNCAVTLCSIIGDDQAGKTIKALLHDAGIETMLHVVPKHQTTLKIRSVEGFHQLMRMDFETQSPALVDCFSSEALNKTIQSADCVIFSDYFKGALAKMDSLVSYCKTAQTPTLLDPKPHPNAPYVGVDWIKPNLKEFHAFIQHAKLKEMPEHEAANKLRLTNNWTHLLITKGEQGMSYYGPNTHFNLPTDPATIYDVTGAGDTVTATLAMALTNNYTEQEAIELSNLAGKLAVQKKGTAQISTHELFLAYADQIKKTIDMTSSVDFFRYIEAYKKTKKKIVFTNGCFDLLHYGHITYLKAAKKLGDFLVIGLNSDASCKRLKGRTRPFNQQTHRSQLLMALDCVDAVIVFEEDTPLKLIQKIAPNVLVKGGDYNKKDIVGHDFVTQTGGIVHILSFVDGLSTTQLAEKIKADVT
jgi:D-beta-D-heptose 7-phosphate kinase / D-beta-D-heptose 1-phosphate adenosyltransferase